MRMHAITRNKPCKNVPHDVGHLYSTAPLNFARARLMKTSEETMINTNNIKPSNLYWILDTMSRTIDVKSSGHLPETIIGSESTGIFVN